MHAGIKNNDAHSASNQTISATREYDAFGNVTSSTGSFTGRFGYGGPYGYQEDDGGLKQLGHRIYDPVCGRFVTKDPIKDGRNWYAYCDNNPLKFSDPDGERQRWTTRLKNRSGEDVTVVADFSEDGLGTRSFVVESGETTATGVDCDYILLGVDKDGNRVWMKLAQGVAYVIKGRDKNGMLIVEPEDGLWNTIVAAVMPGAEIIAHGPGATDLDKRPMPGGMRPKPWPPNRPRPIQPPLWQPNPAVFGPRPGKKRR